MKGKKKTLFTVVLLLLVGLTSGYIASTYAKYADKIEGNHGTATVAKWAFTTDNPSKEFTIALTPDPHDSTLSAERIAPGTKGSFNIELSNVSTETGVDFTIQLKAIEGAPKHLKFYTDDTYTAAKEVTPGTGTISGQLKAKDPKKLIVPIHWKWAYGESDDVTDQTNVDDTKDGVAAKTLTVGVDITGIQTEPGETEITSHVNTN